MKGTVYIICGPTASGKTSISVELAKQINGEIISADSMQIYKGMSIGTAKATVEEMQGIPHHMLSCVEPDDDYSVALYKKAAEQHIEDILSRGKTPIVAGGTGLYINSLTYDLDFSNRGADDSFREELSRRFDLEPLTVYNELIALDPSSKERIHHNDKKRIIRRLEILKGGAADEYDFDRRSSRYDFRIFALGGDRSKLYERINKRVDNMMELGLEDEARALYARYGENIKAFAAIGYKEFIPYFKGEYTIDKVIYDIKINTRHYAKRQLTWFRRDDRIKWIDPLEFASAREAAMHIANYVEE